LKKYVLSVLCFIVAISPSMVFCEVPADRLAPGAPSAQMWDKFDISFKTILIGGLLVGYRSGIATGAASEHRRINNDTVKSRTEADKLTAKAQGLFYNPISFYVKQTDSFLQTFPVCKKMRITELLARLAQVWATTPLKEDMGYDFIQDIDYEDVEKACSELKSIKNN
jgi:hypothetical protein